VCVVLLCAFGSLTFRQLSQPGLYEDQAWQAVHAARMTRNQPEIDGGKFLTFRLLGRPWPLMRSNYIGPVKTYLFLPFFLLFGISIPVIHVVDSLIGLTTVLTAYLGLRRPLGEGTSALAALLLATDLNFLLASKSDWGPSSFSIAACLMAVSAMLAWSRAPSRVLPAALMGLSIGLGISHKFDFLSCAAAVLLAWLLFYAREAIKQRRAVLAMLACLLVGGAPPLIYNLLSHGATFSQGKQLSQGRAVSFPPTMADLVKLPALFTQQLEAVESMVGSTTVADWITGSGTREEGAPRLPVQLAAQWAPLGLLLLALPGARHRTRVMGALVTVYVVIVAFQALVPFARGPHHLLLAFPFPHLLVAAALGLLLDATNARSGALPGEAWPAKRVVHLGVVCAVVLVAAWLVRANVLLMRSYDLRLQRVGGQGVWSGEAFGDMKAFIDARFPEAEVQLLDWGFAQQFEVLAGDKRASPLFWSLKDDASDVRVLAPYLADPKNIFLAFHAPFSARPQILETVERAASVSGRIVCAESFRQRDGQEAVRVFWSEARGSTDMKQVIGPLVAAGARAGCSPRQEAAAPAPTAPVSTAEASTAREAAPGKNLLQNSSFEQLDGKGLAVGWYHYLTPVVIRDASKAHSGEVAIKGTKAFYSKAVAIEGGRTYSLGHYSRSDVPKQYARLQVNFGGTRGETLDVQIKLVDATTQWEWHEMTVQAPKDATVATIFLQPHQDGDVWFDDVWFGTGAHADPGAPRRQ